MSKTQEQLRIELLRLLDATDKKVFRHEVLKQTISVKLNCKDCGKPFHVILKRRGRKQLRCETCRVVFWKKQKKERKQRNYGPESQSYVRYYKKKYLPYLKTKPRRDWDAPMKPIGTSQDITRDHRANS